MYLLPVRNKHKTYIKFIKDEFGNVYDVDTSVFKIQDGNSVYTKRFSTIVLEESDYQEILDTYELFKKEQDNQLRLFQYNLERAARKHIKGYRRWYFPIENMQNYNLCKEDIYSNAYPRPLKFILNWNGKGDLDTHFQIVDIRNCISEFVNNENISHDIPMLKSRLIKPIIDTVCEKYGLMCNEKGEMSFLNKDLYWKFISDSLNNTIVKEFKNFNIDIKTNYNKRSTFDCYTKVFKLEDMNIIRDESEDENGI